MSLLTKKFTGALKDGDYKVKIVGIQERTYTNPSTNKSSELVDIHIETLAGQHDTITVGETQLDFIIRDLMNAYYPGQDLSAGEVLNDLKDNERFIPVCKYSTTSEIDGHVWTNYSFKPGFIPRKVEFSDTVEELPQ